MRVLALASFPERMAATRFRIAAFAPHLAKRGIEVDFVPWLDDAAAASLYAPGGRSRSFRGALMGSARELAALVRSSRYDAVLVQREAMMAGPPVVEALAMLRLPLVLDYDDAIWIAQGSGLRRAVKCAWKTDWTLRRAAAVIAGSRMLARHAEALGAEAEVIPTVVESEVWTPLPCRERGDLADADGPPVIGWIGTHSTAPQLDLVVPALRRLRSEGVRFEILIIGAGHDFAIEGLEITRRPWTLATEIDDFRRIDIGLAPMFSTDWHEGKCGFKQVQYMAVGVPCVSSLVGGARDFVRDGENALVADEPDAWYRHLRALLTDRELRARLSRAGRQLVETSLCVERQADVLETVLRRAAAR